MGQSTPIVTHSPTTNYLVGQDIEGHWILRDARGLTGGLFVSRTAAVRFARSETDHRPDAVMFVPEAVKLSLSGAVPPL